MRRAIKLVERGRADCAFAGQRAHRVRGHIVDHAFVAAAHEASHHVRPHTPQTDHADLHLPSSRYAFPLSVHGSTTSLDYEHHQDTPNWRARHPGVAPPLSCRQRCPRSGGERQCATACGHAGSRESSSSGDGLPSARSFLTKACRPRSATVDRRQRPRYTSAVRSSSPSPFHSQSLGAVVLVLVVYTCCSWAHAQTVPEDVHLVGPPLAALRSKIADPNWLVAWLLKPSHPRRPPFMREFSLSREEALIVARYLYSGSPPRDVGAAWRGGDVRKGEQLFVSRGCRACHAIGSTEPVPFARAPDLAGIGLKVRGVWLFRWLTSPRAYDPDTAMPQLGLSNDDIRHLVAFLLSHREGGAALAGAPPYDPRISPSAAARVIDRLACAKCHLINGFQTVTPKHGWAVAPPSCNKCHEVTGTSEPPSNQATAADEAEVALRDGRRLVAYYGCRGCHRIEGKGNVIADFVERKTFAPPALDGEGARVQPSWLSEYLQHPKPLRPWMQLRNPSFDLSAAEAVALTRYFAALAYVSATDETPPSTRRPPCGCLANDASRISSACSAIHQMVGRHYPRISTLRIWRSIWRSRRCACDRRGCGSSSPGRRWSSGRKPVCRRCSTPPMAFRTSSTRSATSPRSRRTCTT